MIHLLRILFFHPDGSFLPEMTNKDGNPKYKYYHYSTHSVSASMEEVWYKIFLYLSVMELQKRAEVFEKDYEIKCCFGMVGRGVIYHDCYYNNYV